MCRLTFEDFCLLTPFEFSEVVSAVHEQEELHQRETWEQLRVLGTLTVSPWAKGSLKPRDVLPLPWDNEVQDEGTHEIASKEEASARFHALMARRAASKQTQDDGSTTTKGDGEGMERPPKDV